MCDWSQVNLAVDAENELEAEERRLFTWLTMNDRGEYTIDNMDLFISVVLRVHAKNHSVAPNLFVRPIPNDPSSNTDGLKGRWACAVRKSYGNRGVCLDIVKDCGSAQMLVTQVLESATGYAPRSFGMPK